jgi:hypothetical protein
MIWAIGAGNPGSNGPDFFVPRAHRATFFKKAAFSPHLDLPKKRTIRAK